MHSRPPSRPTAADSFFSPALPRVFAHRGLALEAPENTMLAFLGALSAGAEYLETDVHVSYDGVAVVAHDADLRRVAGRGVRVEQLTMSELRRIDLGHGQSFSSLTEVLDAFPGARFNIDVKSAAAVGAVVRAISEAGAVGRVLVASFDERRRRQVVRQLPGVATSASRGTAAWVSLAGLIGSTVVARWALRHVHAVQLPETMYGIRIVSPRLVRVVHAVGAEVHVWTINDVATMSKLLGWSVDGIVTDRADVALALVSSKK